jgi:hypothetical protein
MRELTQLSRIRVQGRPIRVVVEAKRSAFPRDIRNYTRHLGNMVKRRGAVEDLTFSLGQAISTLVPCEAHKVVTREPYRPQQVPDKGQALRQ